MRMVVVFPAPLVPSKAYTPGFGMEKLRWSTTVFSPYRLVKSITSRLIRFSFADIKLDHLAWTYYTKEHPEMQWIFG